MKRFNTDQFSTQEDLTHLSRVSKDSEIQDLNYGNLSNGKENKFFDGKSHTSTEPESIKEDLHTAQIRTPPL